MLSTMLRQHRECLGLTQEQVAQALHIDRSTYAYYELGRSNPSLEAIVRLANIFGVTTDALLCRETGHVERIRDEDFTFLCKEEQNLLLCYRQLPTKWHDDLHKFMAALTSNHR